MRHLPPGWPRSSAPLSRPGSTKLAAPPHTGCSGGVRRHAPAVGEAASWSGSQQDLVAPPDLGRVLVAKAFDSTNAGLVPTEARSMLTCCCMPSAPRIGPSAMRLSEGPGRARDRRGPKTGKQITSHRSADRSSASARGSQTGCASSRRSNGSG